MNFLTAEISFCAWQGLLSGVQSAAGRACINCRCSSSIFSAVSCYVCFLKDLKFVVCKLIVLLCLLPLFVSIKYIDLSSAKVSCEHSRILYAVVVETMSDWHSPTSIDHIRLHNIPANSWPSNNKRIIPCDRTGQRLYPIHLKKSDDTYIAWCTGHIGG